MNNRDWPSIAVRRDFRIQKDDPAQWYLQSAFAAAADTASILCSHMRWESGWHFDLPVDEHWPPLFRVVLGSELHNDEENFLASGIWPLMRIPCGVLLIGENVWNVEFTPRGGQGLRVRWHDRCACVFVEPGNYQIGIFQYGSGLSFLFQMRKLRTSVFEKCSKMQLMPQRRRWPSVKFAHRGNLVQVVHSAECNGSVSPAKDFSDSTFQHDDIIVPANELIAKELISLSQ